MQSFQSWREGYRLTLFLLALFALAGSALADLTEAQQVDLSYYSTFEDTTKGIAAELPTTGAGAWDTSGTPTFTVAPQNVRVFNVGTGWTDSQTVLAAADAAFTIAFRARLSSTAKGILFAFGSRNEDSAGGLAFRRGETAGSFQVTVGNAVTEPIFTYTPPSESAIDSLYRNYALTYANSTFTLYVDGVQSGDAVSAPSGTIIAPQFQWGTRHGNVISGEAAGGGLIDVLGVWKRALTATEAAEIATEMTPTPLPSSTVSFSVPKGWTTKTVPTQAVQVDLSGALALEQEGIFRQTLGDRQANVAEVTDSSGEFNLFGMNDSSHGDKTQLSRDVWLKVSGGSHSIIVGGSENHWQSSHMTPLEGDIFVELGAKATTKNLVGVSYKSGDGTNAASTWEAFTGNACVVVSGTVTGTLVGGAISAHRCTPKLTGNTLVRVLSVQGTNNDALDPGNRIIGSSAWMNSSNSSGAQQIGNAAVEIELLDNATGEFKKEVVGGSCAKGSSYTIDGKTEVLIKAPNGVTFTQPIYGGSISEDSTATITKTASVTLDGGQYVKVYAGGKGANAGITGGATLTLKKGVFSGATLAPSAAGAPVGSSTLVIDGGEAGIDLSEATELGAFGALQLKSGLNLGAHRLPSAALTMDGAQTLTVAVTEAEIVDRRVVLGRADAVPAGLTIEATGVPEGETWSLAVQAGELCYVPPAGAREWVTPTEGNNWADGLPEFQNGDDVKLGANSAEEPVTLTAAVRVGELTVSGSYTVQGIPLSATTATVEATGALSVGKLSGINYLRLTPSGAVGQTNNAYPGIAELKLYQDGQPLEWPSGTTVQQVNADGTTSAPNWAAGGNEAPNALIDGVYGPGTENGTWLNPEDGSTGAYNNRREYNKWWPKDQSGASAVITLGESVAFDGYLIWHTDHMPRSPREWTLEVSADGTQWKTIDHQQNLPESEFNMKNINAAYNEGEPYRVGLLLSVENQLTVNGILSGAGTIVGDVTFAEGSKLKVSADKVLTITGAISGTLTLDISALGELDDATVAPVLRAAEGLTFTPPEGYAVQYLDGTYWLARALTQPLTLLLDENKGWTEAPWQDSSETPIDVAPTQWEFIPEDTLHATVTATANATLTVDKARTVTSFTVGESEQTLTLAGEKLTVSGALACNADLVAAIEKLSAGSIQIDAAKTLTLSSDTYVQSIDGADKPGIGNTDNFGSALFALPAISGSGTLVKTGAGALAVISETLEPSVHVQQGALHFGATRSAAIHVEVDDGAEVRFSSWLESFNSSLNTFTLNEGAKMVLANGNTVAGAVTVNATDANPAQIQGVSSSNATMTFTVTGKGTLELAEGGKLGGGSAEMCTRNVVFSGIISDATDGKLKLRCADTDGTVITLSGANTYTGGTEVASPVTASNADALGAGPVSVASGVTLTVSETTLNVYSTLSGLGTVSGAIQLQAAAKFDCSAATADACLALGTLSVAEGVTSVPVVLPAGVASGTKLLTWTAKPTGVVFVADTTTPLSSLAGLTVGDDGLYYRVMEDTGSAGSDGTLSDLSSAHQEALVQAAFEAGATDLVVTGTTKGTEPLTATQIDSALTCFSGITGSPTVEGSTATIAVAYNFGITKMEMNADKTAITVTVKVEGQADATATFTPGVVVTLVDENGNALAGVDPVTASSDSEVTLTLPLSDTIPAFKAKVAAPTAP